MKNYIILFIVCVISFFAVLHMYNRGVLNVMFTSGRILCSTILNAEINYYSDHNEFRYLDRTSFDELLLIDSRNNLFFPSFSVSKLNDNKSAISVFGINDLKNYELILEFDENSTVTSDPRKLKVKVVKHKSK
ncbi:MAG: hypothetical protein PHR82_04630 [Endomicrobiaceae bacterium]|nr:hypothetical protein [Endomicrobiaceae bacterium]